LIGSYQQGGVLTAAKDKTIKLILESGMDPSGLDY